MKKLLSIVFFLIVGLTAFPGQAFSQETEEDSQEEKDKRPVSEPFEAGILLDNQTVVMRPANSLEFMIQHRFGTVRSTSFDLIGLYAPSNIRLGLSYALTDYLQMGIGSTKNNKLQDVHWKLRLLRQTRSNSVPVGLAYTGNIEFSVKEKESFGIEYEFAHRMSYFHQMIVSRKINHRVSVQAMAKFAHFNQVDTIAFPGLKHNNIALGLNGRVKVTPQLGIIFAYDQPLTTPEQIKPNASLGIEIRTLGHSFQIFAGSYSRISPQNNMVFNTNDFSKFDVLLGFNINRVWNL